MELSYCTFDDASIEELARGAVTDPKRLQALVSIVGSSVSAAAGSVAGQAWECESRIDLASYHRGKTGSLFAAATMAGAAATGQDHRDWNTLGLKIGEAYQVADDIRDLAAEPEEIGKPVGRDDALNRPNAARELGLQQAIKRLEGLVEEAITSIPECPGRERLCGLMRETARLFLPKKLRPAA